MESTKSILSLLSQVDTIAKHSEELSKLNGENFNIFSILGLESNENRTHSNFIAALLNPKGSHGLSNVFLDLFIKHINFINPDFETLSASVIVENFIGFIDFENKTGGRIDIDIIAQNGFSIVIENKIYAGDQFAQIERYKNYKKANCEVYYLTLEGNEPSNESKGNLNSGVDFHCISYKENIVNWLEDCIKEATHQPILRETIKQYIILIKKLTGQLTNHKMEKDILKLIQSNFESANLIKSNFDKAKFEICDVVRNEFITRIKHKYSNMFSVEYNHNIEAKNAYVWLRLIEHPNSNTVIGLEPFSGIGGLGSKLFIGFLDFEENNKSFYLNYSEIQHDGWWRGRTFFQDFEGLEVNLSNYNLLGLITNSQDKFDLFIEHIWKHVIKFIDDNLYILKDVCLKESQQLLNTVNNI